MDLEGAPYGGSRYPVDARMDGRTFVKFHLDAGVGDTVLEPIDTLAPRDWLGFAGVLVAPFPVLSAEQQFAEKYHRRRRRISLAYTSVRGDRPNSRVRDLVDLVLLLRKANLKADRLRIALHATFTRRGMVITKVGQKPISEETLNSPVSSHGRPIAEQYSITPDRGHARREPGMPGAS